MGKKSKSKRKSNPQDKNRKRTEVILKVLSGGITATAGAAELGVSRKTYHMWENRALDAMSAALEDRPPGRPAPPPEAAEIRRLEAEKQELAAELEMTQKREKLVETAWKLKVAELKGKMEKKQSH